MRAWDWEGKPTIYSAGLGYGQIMWFRDYNVCGWEQKWERKYLT